MSAQQMELTFTDAGAWRPPLNRRQRRLTRAQWWFAQMRAVVDRALDWESVPPPPPRQAHLSLATAR